MDKDKPREAGEYDNPIRVGTKDGYKCLRVGELISLLQQHDQSLPVAVYSRDEATPVSGAEVDDDVYGCEDWYLVIS